MKFVKGQWYSDGERFYQYHDIGYSSHILYFRMAGDNLPLPYGQPEKLTPASLTPDFSNVKVGDDCFSICRGICTITEICDNWIKYITPIRKIDSCYMNGNGLSPRIDGKEYWDDLYPSLFNTFAQFMSYWAEEGLKMKEEKDGYK